MYKTFMFEIQQLAVAPDQQEKLSCKLHAHTIGYMHALIKLRRYKEVGLRDSLLRTMPKRNKPPDK